MVTKCTACCSASDMVDVAEKTHRINGLATPTPACDGERVYVYFGSFGPLCYDVDGRDLYPAF